MVGVWVISTCWSTSGSRRETTSVPPQSGQPSRVWGWKLVPSWGGTGARKCCSCPGCPPFFRFLPPLGSGFFGLTMSLDGGLGEGDESFRGGANPGCRPAFSASSVATGCDRCSQFRQGLASRSFMGQEATHPWPPDQDQPD